MRRAVLLSIVLSIGVSVRAQSDITTPMTEAISSGNAGKIGGYFSTSVDLSLPGVEDMYPSQEAVKLLTQFFVQHPAKAFLVKHRGTSKLNDQYRIGELTTGKGIFRVTFFMKKEGERFMVNQFRIESSGDDF